MLPVRQNHRLVDKATWPMGSGMQTGLDVHGAGMPGQGRRAWRLVRGTDSCVRDGGSLDGKVGIRSKINEKLEIIDDREGSQRAKATDARGTVQGRDGQRSRGTGRDKLVRHDTQLTSGQVCSPASDDDEKNATGEAGDTAICGRQEWFILMGSGVKISYVAGIAPKPGAKGLVRRKSSLGLGRTRTEIRRERRCSREENTVGTCDGGCFGVGTRRQRHALKRQGPQGGAMLDKARREPPKNGQHQGRGQGHKGFECNQYDDNAHFFNACWTREEAGEREGCDQTRCTTHLQ